MLQSHSDIHNPLSFPTMEQDSVIKSDLISRTEVIDSIEKCQKIVNNILNGESKVIGVDLEGIHLQNIALVQVSTADRRIFLFRTGRNHDLFREGNLRKIFENDQLTKVMHGAVSDCSALHKAGILISNLYDTAIAHQIIRFQDHGELMSAKMNMISFNALCVEYDTKIRNLVKDDMKDAIWRRADELVSSKNLPEDLLVYSAFDVDPLLEICKDFFHLVVLLNEVEIVRALDPELAKIKIKEINEIEQRTVFISKIPDGITKPKLYQMLASYPFGKTVLIGQSSAQILTDTRKNASQACKVLSETMSSEVRMIEELTESEVSMNKQELSKFKDELISLGFILDDQKISDCVTKLLELKDKVALVKFAIKDGQAVMDLNFGTNNKMHQIRFLLDESSVNPPAPKAGLRKLLESTDFVKVVDKLDNTLTISAFKILSRMKIQPNGFFDICQAMKVLDYWLFGVSFMIRPTSKLGDILSRIRISKETPRNLLLAYDVISTQLSPKCKEILQFKTKIELQALLGKPEAAEARRTMKHKYENNAIYIFGDWQNSVSSEIIQNQLEKYLFDRRIKYNEVIALTSDVLIVELEKKFLVRGLRNAILSEKNDPTFNRIRCFVKAIETTPNKDPIELMNVDLTAMESTAESRAESHIETFNSFLAINNQSKDCTEENLEAQNK